MPSYKIISDVLHSSDCESEIELNSIEETDLRLSHGIYEFLQLDIIPTQTNLLKGKIGLAFFKIWKLRKRKKAIYSLGLNTKSVNT